MFQVIFNGNQITSRSLHFPRYYSKINKLRVVSCIIFYFLIIYRNRQSIVNKGKRYLLYIKYSDNILIEYSSLDGFQIV